MNSALAFLKEFTPRINYILTLPTKILENNRQMKIEKQSVPVMTVAVKENG